MSTIVNNPPAAANSSGPFGLIIGLVVLLVVLYLGYVYGVPAMQHFQVGSPQINVPSKVDVNVHQTN